jgi:hypothetical protein
MRNENLEARLLALEREELFSAKGTATAKELAIGLMPSGYFDQALFKSIPPDTDKAIQLDILSNLVHYMAVMHKGATRKTLGPYSTHPYLAASIGNRDFLVACGCLLHDVVEEVADPKVETLLEASSWHYRLRRRARKNAFRHIFPENYDTLERKVAVIRKDDVNVIYRIEMESMSGKVREIFRKALEDNRADAQTRDRYYKMCDTLTRAVDALTRRKTDDYFQNARRLYQTGDMELSSWSQVSC